MRKTAVVFLWLFASLFGMDAKSDEQVPTYVLDSVPNAQMLGEGRLKVLFWNVYDATLYTPSSGYLSGGPFALSLTYLMDFAGQDIAKRSVVEMQNQGWQETTQLESWENQMITLFPDVKEGDTLVGIQTTEGSARFYYNDTFVGQVDDGEFSKAFFGIWLSPKTSEPKLRRKLLGK